MQVIQVAKAELNCGGGWKLAVFDRSGPAALPQATFF